MLKFTVIEFLAILYILPTLTSSQMTDWLNQQKIEVKFKGITYIKKSAEGFLIDMSQVKVKKFNRTEYVLNGEVTLHHTEIEENITLTLNLFRKFGNGYVQMSLLNLENVRLCEWLKSESFKEVVDDFFKKTDIPKYCPRKNGIYHIYNYSPNRLKEVLRITIKGSFRLDVWFTAIGEIRDGFQLFLSLEEQGGF